MRSALARRSPLRARAPWGVVAFGTVAVLAAAAVGCNDQTPRPPRVTLQSNLGPGAGGAAKGRTFQNQADFVVIGGKGRPVETGARWEGGAVDVECSVVPATNAFTVIGRAVLDGAGDKSGGVTIRGTFPADRSVPFTVTAQFSKSFANFSQQDCTVSYEPGTQQGVAAGRVWGVLSCPTMVDAQKNEECTGTATFKFENCVQ